MQNPLFVRQYIFFSDKAEIAHWRIDGQSGDDGGSFRRIIRPSTWPRPKALVSIGSIKSTSLFGAEVLMGSRSLKMPERSMSNILSNIQSGLNARTI